MYPTSGPDQNAPLFEALVAARAAGQPERVRELTREIAGRNTGLVVMCLQKIGLVDDEDAEFAAWRNLMRCIELFVPALGVRFSTYAVCSMVRTTPVLARRLRLRPCGVSMPAGTERNPDSRLGPAESAEQADMVEALRRALAQLPPKLRTVVELRFLGGQGCEAVARAMGLCKTSVHRRGEEALRRLRVMFCGAMTGCCGTGGGPETARSGRSRLT